MLVSRSSSDDRDAVLASTKLAPASPAAITAPVMCQVGLLPVQSKTVLNLFDEQVTKGIPASAILAAATPPSRAEPNVRISSKAALAEPSAPATNSAGTGFGNRPASAAP